MPRRRLTPEAPTLQPVVRGRGRGRGKRVPAENRGTQGELKLDDITRMNLLRLEAEIRSRRSQLELDTIKLRDHIMRIDKEGTIFRLQADLMALGQHLQATEAEYTQAIKEVEERLGIVLKEYSFDDKSGILHRHDSVKPA